MLNAKKVYFVPSDSGPGETNGTSEVKDKKQQPSNEGRGERR